MFPRAEFLKQIQYNPVLEIAGIKAQSYYSFSRIISIELIQKPNNYKFRFESPSIPPTPPQKWSENLPGFNLELHAHVRYEIGSI